MAADASTVVARVGLDDRGFQEGVAKIQRGLKLVQSEFAAASSKLGDFGKSEEGLRLKADTLNKQIELQKDKVAALEKAYQKSVETKGEDAKATENLKIKLNYATAELNKMEQELKDTTRELKEKSSAWYKLSQSMNSAGDKMKSIGDKMSSIGSKLTTSVTLPLIGIGTAATKMAMDAVESENLFEVSMGAMANDARKWSEETSKALGLNAYNVRKNVATYNSMLTSMGLTSQEALKMSEGLTKLSYDMASFYNLKPEEAFEKLKAGISGEAEPLKALGILVNENTIKTYAYTHGIAKQGEALTEQQKVMARYGVIMESTKNAQGDLARTMDSPTNKLRVMKEQAEQLGIQFGQILIPILEKLIGVIKPLMDKFQGLSKEQQQMIVKIGLIVAAVGPVIGIIGKVISIAGTLSTIIGSVSGAMSTAGGASAVLGSAFTALTGPIGIAVMAIAGITAVGVLLIKNWDNIKESINSLKENITLKFNSIKENISRVWENVKNITTNIWNNIKNSINEHGGGIKGIIGGYIDVYKAVWGKGFEYMNNTTGGKLGEIFEKIKSIANSIKEKLSDMFNFKLPKIKLPHFFIKGEFSLKPPSVPQLEVNWYAKGGIFNRPSIIGVGEAGTEAVLPIDRLDELMARAIEKAKGGSGSGLTLHIENFINNTEKDIEQLAYELEFYRQRVAMGRGGA
ncbi:phage tail tape measure protein [Caproiciproducens sp. MSJ-32]|uniref:phage tail tape measure protein n=1 Tax=Caproiciproducens sp. MSJ-32 TaxID=2841527 RepID=UPI001C11F387|nr:phage tail tape measure protein [Caproiciproducens sp. MSJ-32]MBU5455252.1 phage tail tape measure protein [Caproiciproducens sp. MSJ-32]